MWRKRVGQSQGRGGRSDVKGGQVGGSGNPSPAMQDVHGDVFLAVVGDEHGGNCDSH